MEGTTPKASLFGSATVIAAIISSITALLTTILPGLLNGYKAEPITPTPAPTAVQPLVFSDDAAKLSATRQTPPATAKPNFTYGVWTITSSIDAAGTDFTGSTLKFTSQQETPTGSQLVGFFEWRTGQEVFGREHVVATYDAATRQLFIEGQYVDNPSVLAVGTFSATLSEDGRQLLDGAWGNTPGQLAGNLGAWQARR